VSSQAPGVVLGRRYRLIRELARGGMAAVWEAEDTSLGRRVAVKLLHPQFAREPEFLERFRREARSAASLSHPSIVSVYDVGEEDGGTPFLVMELVDGETLKDRIRRAAPLPDAEIRRIGSAVAAGLAYAHRRGIIHRDVKPQNILLGEDSRARLTDFGIAQALASSGLTRTGAVMGSVHYLAPELVRGRAATQASDIYSLGAVLYEMATGRLPFSGETDLAIALAHVEETPPAPRALNAHVAPALEHTIVRAMAKLPEQRFSSAADLSTALIEPGADTQRITGLPPTRASAPTPAPAPAAVDGTRQKAAAVAYAKPVAVAARPQARARIGGAPRRGASGGVLALLLTMAAVLVAHGAGFYGLASLSREGVATPEPTARPAQPTAPPKAVVGPTPTAAPKPAPSPTAAPSPEPSPTAAPPSATPVPPTATRVPATPTPRTVAVPQLKGKSLREAQAALEAAGLRVTVRGVNVNLDQNVVAEQSPEAGAPSLPNGVVSIQVGTGNTAIPEVTGQTREQAIRLLQDNSFRVQVRERRDERVPAGQAIGTNPSAGTPHERRDQVELFISIGR
jgi:tRNA A-37 threonylcarbamoyl transferase component Bud32